MRVNHSNLQLMHSCLTHFIGEPVKSMDRGADDMIIFETEIGNKGFVEQNWRGSWDIWIGDNVVYEIENSLYEIVAVEKNASLIELYKIVRDMDTLDFQIKSKSFQAIMRASMENVILNMNLPLEGDIRIGNQQVWYRKGRKVAVHLN